MDLRYNHNRYLECKFCTGAGCLACPGEAQKAVAVGLLDDKFVRPRPNLGALLREAFGPYLDAWQAERDALPEHKKNMLRYDEETKIYRDCPVCDGEGCEMCPEEATREYRRQFPDGIKSALIAEISIGFPCNIIR